MGARLCPDVEVTQQLFLMASLMKEHPVRLLLLCLASPRKWWLSKGASTQSVSLMHVHTHTGLHNLKSMFRVEYNKEKLILSGKRVFLLHSYIHLKFAINYTFVLR